MQGPGEAELSHERLFERFNSVFTDPKFASTQSVVEREGSIAAKLRGTTGSNVGVLEALRGLNVDCYRYYAGYNNDPNALRYEAQISRYGQVVAALAFSDIASYERDENAELRELGPTEARDSQVAVRYVLAHMNPRQS